MNHKIDISHKTVFFVSGFLVLLWLVYQIRDVILLFFTAIIFMSALTPIIDFFSQRLRLHKTLGIAVTYIFILGLISSLVVLVVTPFVEQTSSLLISLPHTIGQLLPADIIDKSLLQKQLSDFSKDALSFTVTLFSNFIAFLSVAVLTFYLLLDRERLERLLAQLFVGHEDQSLNLIKQIEDKLGSWLRGQVVLSIVIGIMSYGLLWALAVPYALPLAILAGIMEVVPVIGPIISAVPAALLAYTVSPVTTLLVVIGYLVIQQLENHVIVPQVMRKAVGLNPLVVILAIAVGGRLLGIAGALLAVPITVVLQLVVAGFFNKELFETPKQNNLS